MSAVEKIANHVESPLTRARKLSPSLSHAYNTYPLVEEFSHSILSIQLVNYFATLLAQLVLQVKSQALDKYVPFVFKYYTKVDEFVLSTILVGILEKYTPFIKSLKFADLSPHALFSTAKSQFASLYKAVETKSQPIITSTVNPILSPVNNTLESAIDSYLPKPTATITTTTTVTSTSEINKLVQLTQSAYERSIPALQTKLEEVKKYPGEFQTHVSQVYTSNYEKSDKSISKAIVGTSKDIAIEIKRLGTQKGVTPNNISQVVSQAAEGIQENFPQSVSTVG